MELDELTFDPDTHTYQYEGEVLPNVTTVIRHGQEFTVEDVVDKQTLENARRRGRTVHQIIEEHHLQGRPLRHEEPEVQTRLDGYRSFLEDSKYEPGVVERPLSCDCHRYAGTPDSFGWMRGQRTLIDVKVVASLDEEYVSLQLAAYRHLVEQYLKRTVDSYAVHLKPNGRYGLVVMGQPPAFARFFERLQSYRNDQ